MRKDSKLKDSGGKGKGKQSSSASDENASKGKGKGAKSADGLGTCTYVKARHVLCEKQRLGECCCSRRGDRAMTFDGFAKLCAQAAGLAINIAHYDPKAVGIDAKKAFPFRNMEPVDCLGLNVVPNSLINQHFYAEPRATKDILGWSSTTNLPEDLKERFDEYVKIGRDKKPMKFEIDDKILESLKVPVAV